MIDLTGTKNLSMRGVRIGEETGGFYDISHERFLDILQKGLQDDNYPNEKVVGVEIEGERIKIHTKIYKSTKITL